MTESYIGFAYAKFFKYNYGYLFQHTGTFDELCLMIKGLFGNTCIFKYVKTTTPQVHFNAICTKYIIQKISDNFFNLGRGEMTKVLQEETGIKTVRIQRVNKLL